MVLRETTTGRPVPGAPESKPQPESLPNKSVYNLILNSERPSPRGAIVLFSGKLALLTSAVELDPYGLRDGVR